MAKFIVTTNVNDDDGIKKFTFRIRDMYEKYTTEVTVKASSVQEAKQKVKSQLIGWANFIILSVKDDTGASYYGRDLVNFKDKETVVEDGINTLNSEQIATIKRYADKYEENAEDIMNAISQMVWKKGITAGRAMERVLENVVAGANLNDESTTEELIENSENAELVVDSVYNKFANETDKEFLREAIKEMNRYVSNWSFMSAKEKRNIAPGGKSELQEHLKNAQARLAQLSDSSIADADSYFKVTYQAGDNVYSAVMVASATEDEAKKKFIERKPRYADKIAGVTKVSLDEVQSMRNRGMSVFDSDSCIADADSYFKVTYKAGENVYSAVMVAGATEEDAKKKFTERKPKYADRIAGVTKVSIGEVNSMRARGMSVFDSKFAIKSKLRNDWYYSEYGDFVSMSGSVKKFNTRQEAINKIDGMQSDWEDMYEIVEISDGCAVKDWNGTYNGATYDYTNGKWTITHKNGKVETFPDEKFNKIEELYAYIDSFKDSNQVVSDSGCNLADAIEITKEPGTDKPIYVMQSDLDRQLYFYIGKTYSMKEGTWTYAKFKMNGTSPEQLKRDLEANGWHQVNNGPASIIDSKEGSENYLDVYDSADWDIHYYDAIAGHARELLWKNGPSNNIIDNAINDLNKLIAYLKSVKD